jgi:hypothetical protein
MYFRCKDRCRTCIKDGARSRLAPIRQPKFRRRASINATRIDSDKVNGCGLGRRSSTQNSREQSSCWGYRHGVGDAEYRTTILTSRLSPPCRVLSVPESSSLPLIQDRKSVDARTVSESESTRFRKSGQQPQPLLYHHSPLPLPP